MASDLTEILKLILSRANTYYCDRAQGYDEEIFNKYKQELFNEIWSQFFHKFKDEKKVDKVVT